MAELTPENIYSSILKSLQETPNKIHINYSFGKKSSMLMLLAHESNKDVKATCVRAKNRMFPEILNEMDNITDAWSDLGIKIQFVDINCKKTDNTRKSPCGRELLKMRHSNPNRIYLLSTPKNSRTIIKNTNWIYPFAEYTESEIYSMNYLIPKDLYLDLVKFDMPHWCANPICPRWKATRPQSLEHHIRWTDV